MESHLKLFVLLNDKYKGAVILCTVLRKRLGHLMDMLGYLKINLEASQIGELSI